MKHRNSHSTTIRPLLAGGLMFAFVGLLIDFRSMPIFGPAEERRDACQEVVQSDAALSREQLAKLLTVPERDTKTKVREIVQEPYCKLPGLQVRAGVTAEREVYPLAFDPQTQLVILYESDEYAGYRFIVH